MSRPDEQNETVNRESHPNASGPESLAGDMGISSERTGPFEGIEGTGTLVSSQGRTDGESPVGPDVPDDDEGGDDGVDDADDTDDTAAASGVDRTVGEVRPDPVANKHEFDPSRNPGHGL